MKKKYLVVAIASAMALTACKPAEQQNLSAAENPQTETQHQEMAQVSFGAKFPTGPQAAFIDAATQSLHVVVSKVDAGSIEQAIALTEQDDCRDTYWDNEQQRDVSYCEEKLLGYPVGDLWLTAQDNTGTLELFPGEYRIAVRQFDADPQANGAEPKLIGESVSYTTLSSGSHAVRLNLLRGTWDIEGGPQTLQLLTQAVTDEGGAEVDLDPTQEGVQAVPAELMGLNAAAGIDGVHLLGLHEAKALFDQMQGGEDGGDMTDGEMPVASDDHDYEDPEDHLTELLGAIYAPLLRQGEDIVLPDDRHESIYDDTTDTDTGVEVELDMPAILAQQYTPTDGNKHWLTLGAWNLHSWQENWQEGDRTGIDAGLMFYTDLMDEGPDLEGAEPDGNGNLVVNDQEVEQHGWWEESYQDANGEWQSFYIADFSVENKTETFPQEVEGLLTPTRINDDGTISATLIEYVGRWNGTQKTVTPGDQTGPAPAAEGSAQQSGLQRAVVRELQLQQAAAQLGLTAQAAAEGDNCITVTGTGDGYWSQYMWDGEQWVPGTYNHTYYVEEIWDDNNQIVGYEVRGDDLNGDGSIQPFETYVYENWTCEGPDGMGNCESTYETVSHNGWDHDNTIEACAYQVTLTPRNLDFDISSLLSETEVIVAAEQ